MAIEAMRELEQRISQLEKELREFKQVGAHRKLAVTELLMVQGKFIISDSEMNERFRIGLDESGDPYLLVVAKDGGLRFSLVVQNGNPQVHIYDQAEKIRTSISIDSEKVGIHLYDSTERVRLTLAVGEEQQGIAILDEDGQPVQVLST